MNRVALAGIAIAIGCGGPSDTSPEGAFKQFASAVVASSDDPDALSRAYRLLSPADRRELDRRARQVEQSGGPDTSGAQMLAQGRVMVRWVPRKVKVKSRSGRRAELFVTGPGGKSTKVSMVREGDAWRVDLGLARGPSGGAGG